MYATHLHITINDSVVEMQAKPLSEFNKKYFGDIDCFSIHADTCIVIMKSLVKVPQDSVRHKK